MRRTVIIPIALFVSALAACGDDDDGGASSATGSIAVTAAATAETTTGETTGASAGAATTAGGATTGGTTAGSATIETAPVDEAADVFSDTAAAKQALDTKQIDAIVIDLPTAFFISAVEIEGSQVFGQFPPVDGTDSEEWGLLFAKDNPLVECANLALAALTDSGQLQELTTTWMSDSAGVPEIPLE